jgi:Uncharacterized conserved protein
VNRLPVVLISAITLILAIVVLSMIVDWDESDNGPPSIPVSNGSVVDFMIDNGDVMHINVEIADSPYERNYGLMNRASLPEDAGMLFVFEDDMPKRFWMKNTLIPLDMIFIASNLTIIDIHENATPLSEDVIVSSGPCRYVLEVNGGLCAANGIDVGDRVDMDI